MSTFLVYNKQCSNSSNGIIAMFKVHHSLCCLLDGNTNGSFKALRVCGNPTVEKITEVYRANAYTLAYILAYCKANNITSYRISASMFPLLTHPTYTDTCLKILESIAPLFKRIDYSGIHLSCHPDQFVLLSSMNQNVNENAIRDLNMWAYITKEYIPLDLVNIHVGAKTNGFEIHRDIFLENFAKLNPHAKSLVSLENDEKSYSFLETLSIAQQAGCMMVPDFHHHRCMGNRYDQSVDRLNLDAVIYEHIPQVMALYRSDVLPTFHLSSPFGGWSGGFKGTCKHADFIDTLDYPHLLQDKITRDVRLDIEAKSKQNAIFSLRENLKNAQ